MHPIGKSSTQFGDGIKSQSGHITLQGADKQETVYLPSRLMNF